MTQTRWFPAIAMTAGGALIIGGAFCIFSAGPIHQAEAQQPTRGRTGGDAVKNADELILNLSEARKALGGVSNRGTRDKLELLISRAELQAGDLRKDVIGLLTAAAATTGATVQAMADADFAKLLALVKKEAFDNGKLAFLKQATGGNRFTTSQARELLKSFTFDQGRTEAALIIYPKVVDPGNFFQALDVFTFDSGKQEVMKKIRPAPGK